MATKVTEYLQYYFSDAEKLTMATELSRTLQEQGTLENKKAELAKAIAGEIEAKKATIASLARGISAGYEWRNIECIVRLDCPKQGEATLFRTDTGEAAKVRRMTAEEIQFHLDLQPAESEPAESEPEDDAEQPPNWAARMRAAAGADEGRRIMAELTDAIHGRQVSLGLTPTCGQVEPKFHRHFNVVTQKEWAAAIKAAKKLDPHCGAVLESMIQDGIEACGEPWKALLAAEHGAAEEGV